MQSTGTSNKRLAQQCHDKLKTERWEQDRLGVKPRRTWDEAVTKFLQETQHKRTHAWDQAMLRWFHPYLGGKDLVDINRELLDHVKAQRAKGVTPGTVNRYMALVRAILRRACMDWEWIERMPKVSMMKDRGARIRSLSRDEYARLLAELPEHLAEMVRFSIATGLRQSYVKDLRRCQVSLERRHMWVSAESHKNGTALAVPLNQAAIEVLGWCIGMNSDFVFAYEGRPVAQVSTKAWRNALKRAGIDDFRRHDLRHTFATWHREAGTPTYELQRLGGWKTQSMVERYANVASDGIKMAAQRIEKLVMQVNWQF